MTLDLATKAELLAGRASWKALAHGAVPWLVPALVATDPARARLHEWATAGGLDLPAPTRRELEDAAPHVGDETIHPLVVDVLERIARPAADYLVQHAWVLSVGRDTSGWQQAAPRAPAGAHCLVVVHGRGKSDAEICSTLAHEFAHAWLLPCLTTDVPTRLRLRAFWQTSAANGTLDHDLAEFERFMDRHEVQADLLAEAWGFPRPREHRQERAIEASRALHADVDQVLAAERETTT